MSTGRLIGINLAMWTLGLASLCLFTTAVWWLDGKAVQPPAGLQVAAAPADARPLAGLTAGTARSAATARQHLQGARQAPPPTRSTRRTARPRSATRRVTVR